MADFFTMPPWPPNPPAAVTDRSHQRTESSEAKARPPNGYTSKVHVLDRYKVVGFISSGTYGRVYKAIGVNGQSGDFAIKKYIPQRGIPPQTKDADIITDSSQIRKAK